MSDNKTINLAVINNPFDTSDISRSTLVWSEGLTVQTALTLFNHMEEIVVSVNGEILQTQEEHERLLQADDTLVVCPIPQGGGGGKGILRLVALIAVVLVAPAAASLLTGVTGLTGAAGASFMAAAQIGIAVGGSMAVNALIPIEPAMPAAPSLESTSQSYGIDGAKNTQAEGLRVPVVYGTYRVAGNIVSLYTENVMDDQNQTTQDVFMGMVLSEGPIGNIDTGSILLNDQPIANFGDTIIAYPALGTLDQEVLPFMKRSISPTNVSVTLTTDWATRTTTASVDSVRIDIVAPQGWRSIDSAGTSQPLTELIHIEYSKGDTENWQLMPSDGVVTGFNTTYRYTKDADWRDLPEPQIYTAKQWGTVKSDGTITVQAWDRPGNEYGPVVVGTVIKTPVKSSTVHEVKGMYTSAYRASFQSPPLEHDVYKFRIKRTNPENDDQQVLDTLVWSDLNEIQEDAVAYANTAMLVLKMRLSDQMSGLPNVTVIVKGKEVTIFEANANGELIANTESTANPAWIALDMLTNTRYAGRLPLAQIDIEKFYEWAVYCDTKKLYFNGVFDGQAQNLWDALQYVLRVGRAKIINSGTKYSVAIEKPARPVMMFNVGNIVEKSLNINWLPLADRINELEVTFYDKENDYKQNTLRIVDDAMQAIHERRVTDLNLIGVIDKQQAIDDATFYLNVNRLLTQTVSFTASIEAIACTVGDVVLIQHDIPQWGFGGRTEAGSTTTKVKLDKEVTIENGKTYAVLIHHDKATVQSGNIQSIAAARYVTLPVLYNTAKFNPTNIVIAGEEYFVKGVSLSSDNKPIIALDRPSGAGLNAPYALYQIDYVEERVVTTVVAGTYTEINAAAGILPATYCKWLFGETLKAKKPFRILSISGDSNSLTRTISALEYNENVYSDELQLVSEGTWSSIPTVVHVTDLSAVQIQRVTGGISLPSLRIEWQKGNENYRGADIFAQLEGGNWRQVGSVSHTERVFEYSDIAPNTVVNIKVVAIDQIGARAPFVGAPVVTVTITDGAPLSESEYLTLTTSKSYVVIRWAIPEHSYKAAEIVYTVGPTFDNPTSVGTFTGAVATHQVEFGQAFYYWGRYINTDNQPSGWTPTGVQAGLPRDPAAVALVSPFIGTEFTVQWEDQDDAIGYEVKLYEGATLLRTERITSNRYTYTKAQAVADGATGREFNVTVRAGNICGFLSTNTSSVTALNAPPPLPTNLDVNGGYEILTVNFQPPSDPDFETVKVWMSEDPGFVRNDSTLIASVRGGPILISGVVAAQTYYIRVASYDAWGEGAVSGEYIAEMAELPLPSLSEWATRVDPVDRQFIMDHLEENSIPSTQIVNLVASKLTAGTINALIGIGSQGIIQHYSDDTSYRVTMGPVALAGSTHGVSMFSFMNGFTPIVAFYEDGTATFKGQVIIEPGSTGYTYIADRPTSLAAINSAEGTKLSTVQTGATVGAVWDSNITGQPANTDILNYDETNNTYIERPEGGTFRSASASITGALKITLPQTWTSTMIRFDVEVFNYQTNSSFTAQIAGYNASPGWTQTTAQIVGQAGLAIRLGHDGTKCCVWIGDVTSVWKYPSVRILNVMLSHSNRTAAQWKSGWVVQIVTVLGSVNTIIEANQSLVTASETLFVDGVPAALVLSQLANAQSTADGKIQAFYQNTAPTTADQDDIWFHTGQGNKIYVFRSGAWVVAQDTAIATAVQNAQDAVTIADGKAYVFYATSPPATATEGDLWYNTSVGVNSLYRKRATTGWDLVSTVGAAWYTSLSDMPIRFSDSATLGLNLTATHMGYYNGSAWKTYMTSSGQFYLSGSSPDNYLSWDGTNLAVRGNIEASTIKANVSLSAPVITGGTITAATLNSATLNSAIIRTNNIEITTPSGELILSSGGILQGVGVNLLGNTDFPGASVTGWVTGPSYNGANMTVIRTESTRGGTNSSLRPPAGDALVMHQSGFCTSSGSLFGGDVLAQDIYPLGAWRSYDNRIPVTAGRTYEFSVIAGCHRCYLWIELYWFNASNASISSVPYKVTNGWMDLTRRGGFVVAPAGAVYAEMVYRKTNTQSSPDSYVWIHQPYFGEAGSAQTILSPYSSGTRSQRMGALGQLDQITSANRSSTVAAGAFGAFADVSQINSGNIASYFAPGSINAATYISNLLVGTAQIINASVGTLQIKDQAVTFPTGYYSGQLTPVVNNAWTSLGQYQWAGTGAPGVVFITVKYRHPAKVSGLTHTDGTASIKILINGVAVFGQYLSISEYSMNSDLVVGTVPGNFILGGTVVSVSGFKLIYNFLNGTNNIEVQYIMNYPNASGTNVAPVISVSIFTQEMKR